MGKMDRWGGTWEHEKLKVATREESPIFPTSGVSTKRLLLMFQGLQTRVAESDGVIEVAKTMFQTKTGRKRNKTVCIVFQ